MTTDDQRSREPRNHEDDMVPSRVFKNQEPEKTHHRKIAERERVCDLFLSMKQGEQDAQVGQELLQLPPLGMLGGCGDDPLEYPKQFFTEKAGDGEAKELLLGSVKTGEMKRKLETARHYGATFVLLKIFDRWLELGIRPSRNVLDHLSAAFYSDELSILDKAESTGKDERSPTRLMKTMVELWEQPVDDLVGLNELVNSARLCLWQAAPDPAEDSHLREGPSRIPGAEKGLFAVHDLPAHTICCYYSGDVHSTKSSQSATMLNDGSYLLRIGVMEPQPWWYHALQDEQALGEESQPERTNQPERVGVYNSLREEWDQLVGQAPHSSRDELYVNPSNLQIKARYINDCLEEARYNVLFVMDPSMERAAVVALRHIKADEELYVSYGTAYWNSMEATTGIVPRRLD